jgi:hypothetical protein
VEFISEQMMKLPDAEEGSIDANEESWKKVMDKIENQKNTTREQ